MKSSLEIGEELVAWYFENYRALPWRETRDPYKIWISEVIMQQTQVSQGLGYYERFIARFPDSLVLSQASIDEVLLYWKGLGYYSRALNLHKASKQIQEEFHGVFPTKYEEILRLSGVGKYTASAIASICFNEPRAAVDGNFYRVLSRFFADDMEITSTRAFDYFSQLAMRLMSKKEPGAFNQAVMDLGATVCKPRNPRCEVCPLSRYCLAFMEGTSLDYPRRGRKVRVEEMVIQYYFIYHQNVFLAIQRDESSIWKRLYEFPQKRPSGPLLEVGKEVIHHKLSHKSLTIEIQVFESATQKAFVNLYKDGRVQAIEYSDSLSKSFPRPLEKFIERWAKNAAI